MRSTNCRERTSSGLTRPINKLIFVLLIEEQTFEEEAEAMEDNSGREEQPPISNQLPLEGGQEQV